MKKIKYLFVIICACMCLCLTACGGAGRNVHTPAISMTRYFLDSVNSSYKTDYGSSGSTTLHLPSFVGTKKDETTMLRHNLLTFSGDSNWLDGMYIECVYFYVVANEDLVEKQLSFVMFGLDGGNYDVTAETYKVEQNSIGISAKAGEGKLVRVDIGHKATTKTMTIKFSFNPSDVDFKWTIYGLSVYGEHR